MKIKFLGTAASEGVPALFCACDICKNARAVRGREIRTRCQAIVDDGLLIDFGPDTYLHLLRWSIDISDMPYCLITHAHSDHLYPGDIEAREHGFAVLPPSFPPLTLIGSAGVEECVVRYPDGRVTKDGRVLFLRARAFEPIEFNGYTVVPVPAVHSTKDPLVYAVTRGTESLLYAHDTDILPDGTLEALARLGLRFGLVSMDCTEGKKHIDYHGHMNIERDLLFRQKLFDFGLADGDTVFVANHFSHNGRLTYAEASDPAVNQGLVPSYDGMEIVF